MHLDGINMTDMKQLEYISMLSGLAVEALAWRLSGCLVGHLHQHLPHYQHHQHHHHHHPHHHPFQNSHHDDQWWLIIINLITDPCAWLPSSSIIVTIIIVTIVTITMVTIMMMITDPGAGARPKRGSRRTSSPRRPPSCSQLWKSLEGESQHYSRLVSLQIHPQKYFEFKIVSNNIPN